MIEDLPPYSVIIKTFQRPDCLDRTLSSLQSINPTEVLVGDDASETEYSAYPIVRKHEEFLNIRYVKLPYDSGLSYGRNRLVEYALYQFVLVLDDDMGVLENVTALLRLLKDSDRLGGVSGLIHNGESDYSSSTNLYVLGQCVIKTMGLPRRSIPADYVEHVSKTDLIPNAGFFRRDLLLRYPWDEKYKIGKEHLDFFLRQKQLGLWDFATQNSRCFVHWPDTKNYSYASSYRNARDRQAVSDNYFRLKWGIQFLCKGSILKGYKHATKRSDMAHQAMRAGHSFFLDLLISSGNWRALELYAKNVRFRREALISSVLPRE